MLSPLPAAKAPHANSAMQADNFASRHIGPRQSDLPRMLQTVGAESLDALLDEAIPSGIRQQHPLAFGAALSESELLDKMRSVASRNTIVTSMIGQGYYGTYLPPVIQRNVLESPAWYTAYTPYQPEISQGRLEALMNFQTMIADLTGLDIANASLLDEATAAAEAMAMARRVGQSGAQAFFVDRDCHPQTIAVVRTRAEPLGWTVVVGDPAKDLDAKAVFGALLQYPGSSGALRDLKALCEALHADKAIAIVAADLLALALIVPPGEFGADIAIGSTQRFGLPMGYGGPHAGFLACRTSYQRSIPGRLVGATIDSHGHPAYRLALQTREQHIRREKATSNICTAQVLPAVIASMYGVYHGPEGLRQIAARVAQTAAVLARGLSDRDWRIAHAIISTRSSSKPEAGATRSSIVLGKTASIYGGCRTASASAATRRRRLRSSNAFGLRSGARTAAGRTFTRISRCLLSKSPMRFRLRSGATSDFMMHSVFHEHRSETEMLRYLRRLSDRDLALDRTMIPLGSCTMKLNGTAEMMPLTWPGFAALHPFAPVDQARGYAEMIGRSQSQADRDFGLRRCLAAAELGSPGRVYRLAGDPRLSSRPWRPEPNDLPHPDVGAWDESGLRAHGRHGRGCGRLRRQRQCRSRGSRWKAEEHAAARRDHDHLSFDAWRF